MECLSSYKWEVDKSLKRLKCFQLQLSNRIDDLPTA